MARFRETVRDWVHGHDAQGPMHLAIFFDAAAVAGDAALLADVQEHMARVATASDAFIARFGAAAAITLMAPRIVRDALDQGAGPL